MKAHNSSPKFVPRHLLSVIRSLSFLEFSFHVNCLIKITAKLFATLGGHQWKQIKILAVLQFGDT